MTNEEWVLVVSTAADVATDEVISHLSACGVPHHRFNTEDYPFFKAVAFRPGRESREPWAVVRGKPLPRPTAVWYRRLRCPSRPGEMDEGVYDFCLKEGRAAFMGSIVGLPARWMGHPAAIWQAEFKPFQLQVARKTGLKIPRTLITNDPGEIRAAFDEFRSMVVKPCRTGYVSSQEGEFAVFTSRVMESHLESLEGARWSPAIYQELVAKLWDVRVTVVGRKLFAAAIESQSDPEAAVDWRCTANPKLPHRRVSLPSSVENKILQMTASLGLEFGAIDMIQTPDGEYVFLEVNPNGQWVWLDDILELGISRAVADWLGGTDNGMAR